MLKETELKQKLEIVEKAIPGPYFTAADAAHDAPDHENSGLAMVETGRSDDWWIARLVEWPTANFIAAFDPSTCAELVREVMRLREQIDKSQTCVVCTATLLESDTPPHCEDCVLTEEHYER